MGYFTTGSPSKWTHTTNCIQREKRIKNKTVPPCIRHLKKCTNRNIYSLYVLYTSVMFYGCLHLSCVSHPCTDIHHKLIFLTRCKIYDIVNWKFMFYFVATWMHLRTHIGIAKKNEIKWTQPCNHNKIWYASDTIFISVRKCAISSSNYSDLSAIHLCIYTKW